VPPVKAVLDTNVIVSALLKDGGREALLVDLALSGSFTLVVSNALLEEYEEVLRRPGFGFNPTQVTRSLRAIRDTAIIVQPQKQLHVTRDPDDNKVLECALEAGAEYVVSGNTRDFPKEFQGIRIVPPRQFLVILAAHLE
jgi:putative PIN family toxin of toxin-antitoxin system